MGKYLYYRSGDISSILLFPLSLYFTIIERKPERATIFKQLQFTPIGIKSVQYQPFFTGGNDFFHST